MAFYHWWATNNYHTFSWYILQAFSSFYINNRLEWWESKSKLKNLPTAITIFCFLPLSSVGKWNVSCGRCIMLCHLPLLHDHSLLLLHCGVPHEMPFFLNWSHSGFPQAAALQEMLQYGNIPRGSFVGTALLLHRSLQAAGSSALLTHLGLFSMSAALARAAPAGALHRLQLFRLLLLLHRGLLHGCRWRSALCDAQVLQRNKMLYHKPLLGSGSFFTVSGACPAFLPWPWGLLFLPHVLSLLSYFCAFFQSTLPEAQPVLLTGSALDRGRLLLELAGTAPGLLRSLSLAIETLLC